MSATRKRFLQQVREDPLFAAEGLDLEHAEQAIDAIESAISDLESLLSKGSWRRRLFLVRYPLARYAVPLSFLRAFVGSERLRRAFLSAPDDENAQKLLEGWRAASRELIKSVRRYTLFHRLMYAIEKQKSSFEFHDLMGNKTTLADVDRMLELMKQNAERLESTVQERERTWKSGISHEITSAIAPVAQTLPAFEEGVLSPLHMRLHEQELRDMSLTKKDVVETYGPLWYELPHFDALPTRHLFMVYVTRDPRDDLHGARIFLVDRYFFLPIKGPRVRFGHTGKAIYEPLIRRGLRYWHQPAVTLYAVRDHRYWADILTMVDCRRRPHLDKRLLETQRSSLLDLLLATAARNVRLYIGNTRERLALGEFREYSLLFGLLMQSQPSIFFLPFNGSVWRVPEEPDFLGSEKIREEDQMYVTEESVIADTTPEEMDTIMRGIHIRKEERERMERARDTQ